MKPSYEELVKQNEELQRKVDALVVENAAVKQQKPLAWFIQIGESVTTDQIEASKWKGLPLVRVDMETPATDAALADVEARGIEKFADNLAAVGNHEHHYAVIARNFANQLRKESGQ